MTNKIEISHTLADRLTRAYPAEITDQETMQAIRIEALAALDELRAILAAPSVERQEPVAWRMDFADGNENYGFTESKAHAEKVTADPYYKVTPLYTSPPAPVAVVLPERKCVSNRYTVYNPAIEWNACLDKVKEMNK